jgi:hypothetical protein
MNILEQVRTGTHHRRLHSIVSLGVACAFGCVAPSAHALLPGWSTQLPVTVTETSGVALSNYQVRMVLDTASLVSGGVMNADASDLRFGTDETGSTLLDYWIESGANTATTVVWIKLPALAASQTTGIFLFTGNAAAPAASTLNVFEYQDPNFNSATNQVASGGAGGVGNSQRGFRFSPNEDVLAIQFGKYEPTGTTRYITLFDNATQAIVAQMQVAGPPATYTYANLAQPIWLTQGTQYVLEMYQDTSDGYFFGTSSQINPKLTYYDMRYCNGCSQNTFPNNFLNGYHYGYPDLEFMTRQHAASEPTAVQGAGPTVTSLLSSGTPVIGNPVTFTASVDGLFGVTGNVAFFDSATAIAGCESVALDANDPPTASCTTSALTVGSHDITATYAGDVDDATSTSEILTQIVDPMASSTTLGTGCMITSVEGQPYTFNANVSGLSPTGSVDFVDGATTLCAAVPLLAGSASCTTTFDVSAPLEVHAIAANYSGDAQNTTSNSAMLMLSILNIDEAVFRNGFDLEQPGCPAQ